MDIKHKIKTECNARATVAKVNQKLIKARKKMKEEPYIGSYKTEIDGNIAKVIKVTKKIDRLKS